MKRKEANEPAEFEVQFQKDATVFSAKPGTIEHFLTERYCFYAQFSQGLYRVDVHHWPWPLQKAEGKISRNSLLNGVEVEESVPPLFHYSSGVDVVSWAPIQV